MNNRDLEQMRILYVEDDSFIREEIGMFLEMETKEVIYAENGEVGLDAYRKHHPDIIVSDIRMPKMDGLEMSRIIKQENREQLILIMTAFNDSEFLFKAIETGVDHYITKPVNLDLLEQKLWDMARSVMQKKELEKTLHLLEQYKQAVDQSAIFSKSDLSGRITYANDKLCEITGYSKEELIGKGHSIFRHPHVPKDVYASMWETIQQKQPWTGVIKNMTKNGDPYYVKAYIVPIKELDGEVAEYISIRHDITEQEEYREILEDQLDVSIKGLGEKIHTVKEYEKAIDAGTAFVRLNTDEKIYAANHSFCELMEADRDSLIGQAYLSLCNDPQLCCACAEGLEVFRSKEIKHDVAQLRTHKGNVLHCSVTYIPILNQQGNVREVMILHHDITEVVHLTQEIENTQKEVVFTMGAIGESRSKETGNHVKRVAEYSYILAKKIGLGAEEAELIRQASPMHDIGKVAIPDAVLNKPGKLDDLEWGVMRTHAKLGYSMLQHSNRPLMKTAAVISHSHHERWDGKGYPAGLSGDAIPMVGRITALADVFDALGSDRCYKKAWDDEQIFQLFKEERGRQFDPRLVDIFFENLDAFLEIRERFKDEL